MLMQITAADHLMVYRTIPLPDENRSSAAGDCLLPRNSCMTSGLVAPLSHIAENWKTKAGIKMKGPVLIKHPEWIINGGWQKRLGSRPWLCIRHAQTCRASEWRLETQGDCKLADSLEVQIFEGEVGLHNASSLNSRPKHILLRGDVVRPGYPLQVIQVAGGGKKM